MLNLPYRIEILCQLGDYISTDNEEWQTVKEKAGYENGWFTPEFINTATTQIARHFLQKEKLEEWAALYKIADEPTTQKQVGLIMAGNIPLVGFHDFLCLFISGHKAVIKPSSKDQVLIKHLVNKLIEWEQEVSNYITFADMLKNCDAYIATGSNNSAGYFEYYFSKYPHIIRRNRTSVAILTGKETTDELEKLADDVFYYFGLGCRNVTKLFVPVDYNFIPLITAFKKYDYLAEHTKLKNNYDYNLALHILNKQYYMSTAALLLVESKSVFSPISQINYEYYTHSPTEHLLQNPDIQCIVGDGFIPFGNSQQPTLTDYADGVDTLSFLTSLK